MTQEWPKYGVRSDIMVVTTQLIIYAFEFQDIKSIIISFRVNLGQKKPKNAKNKAKVAKFRENRGCTRLCPIIAALRTFFGFKDHATSIEHNQTNKISKNKKICRRDSSHAQKRINFPHIAQNAQSTKISDFLRKSSRSKLLSISLKENAEIFLFKEFFYKKLKILDYTLFPRMGGGLGRVVLSSENLQMAGIRPPHG